MSESHSIVNYGKYFWNAEWIWVFKLVLKADSCFAELYFDSQKDDIYVWKSRLKQTSRCTVIIQITNWNRLSDATLFYSLEENGIRL